MLDLLPKIEFWHWWVLAEVLIALEVFVPSTVLLWPGLAAIVVGIVLFAAPNLSWEMQVLLFAVLSVICIVAWRAYARGRPTQTEDSQLNLRAERLVDREITLTEPLADGRGKVTLDGVMWTVAGGELEAGAKVRVTEVDGTILKIERA